MLGVVGISHFNGEMPGMDPDILGEELYVWL